MALISGLVHAGKYFVKKATHSSNNKTSPIKIKERKEQMRKGKREYAAGGVVKAIKAAIKAKAGAKKRLSKEEKKARDTLKEDLIQEYRDQPDPGIEYFLNEFDNIPLSELKKMLSKKDRRALAKSIYGNPGKEAKRPFKKGKSGTSKIEREADI